MAERNEVHRVPAEIDPVRLSDYAGGIFETIPTRKGMKKAIDRGWVLIDGRLAHTGDWLRGGELLTLSLDIVEKNKPVFDFKLQVIYEDDFLALIEKPAGMLVSGNAFRTVENALSSNLKKSHSENAMIRPKVVHRLDFPTRGILLVAKTRNALTQLKAQFESQSIEKTYHAIVIGDIEGEGDFSNPIDRKQSLTYYKVLDRQASDKYGFLNLLRLKPVTGRRHQIRKHLAEVGNAILGDPDYGPFSEEKHQRGLYLHATEIRFTHPESQEQMTFALPIPPKFRRIFRDYRLTE